MLLPRKEEEDGNETQRGNPTVMRPLIIIQIAFCLAPVAGLQSEVIHWRMILHGIQLKDHFLSCLFRDGERTLLKYRNNTGDYWWWKTVPYFCPRACLRVLLRRSTDLRHQKTCRLLLFSLLKKVFPIPSLYCSSYTYILCCSYHTESQTQMLSGP